MRESILVPVNGQLANECALPAAALLARATGTRLVLLGVESWAAGHAAAAAAQRRLTESKASEHLARVATELRQQGLEIEAHVAWAGSTREIPATIAETAAAQNARLIVMCASIRHGWAKRLGPSVADQVVAAGSVPVFLIQPGNRLFSGKSLPVGTSLLVPLDGSPVAETALPHAIELARLLRARLVLIYAVSPLVVPESSVYTYRLVDNLLSDQCNKGRSYLARIASQLEPEGLLVRPRVHVGDRVQVLLEEVTEYRSALIILTADRPTRWRRWMMDSATDRLLCESACPVVLLNGDRPSMSKGVRCASALHADLTSPIV